MPSSPRDSRKNAVLVPPKLSSDLQLCSTVLGQFLRNSDGIFCKVARESWHFGPDQFRRMIALFARQPDRAATVLDLGRTWAVHTISSDEALFPCLLPSLVPLNLVRENGEERGDVGRLFVQRVACSCPREAQANNNNAVRNGRGEREREGGIGVTPSHIKVNLELCSCCIDSVPSWALSGTKMGAFVRIRYS